MFRCNNFVLITLDNYKMQQIFFSFCTRKKVIKIPKTEKKRSEKSREALKIKLEILGWNYSAPKPVLATSTVSVARHVYRSPP